MYFNCFTLLVFFFSSDTQIVLSLNSDSPFKLASIHVDMTSIIYDIVLVFLVNHVPGSFVHFWPPRNPGFFEGEVAFRYHSLGARGVLAARLVIGSWIYSGQS